VAAHSCLSFPISEVGIMQVTVIVDASGKLIAAHRAKPGARVGTGIGPVEKGHTSHLIDLPKDLEETTLQEVVKRFRVGADGKPGWG
jgi:hypothetical protein